MTNDTYNYREKLWLCTAVQNPDDRYKPFVRFSKRKVSHLEMVLVDGLLFLVGEEFGDDMKGFNYTDYLE